MRRQLKDTVPVLIVTLNRYEHFERCLRSLEKNSLAKDTEIFIGIDYPFKEEHWDGYRKICNLLERNTFDFKKVTVLKHKKNVGVEKNHYLTRDLLYKKYDSYIFSEDDNEFSSDYLEYMNKVMSKYRNDENILAVSGYSYPVNTEGLENGVLFSLDTYFSAFGYGIWKQKDELMCKTINMSTFMTYYSDRRKMKELRRRSTNQYCNFVKGMVEYIPELIKNGEVKKIDLSYGLYMFFNHKKMIFPLVSKVRNTGYDGSGENCGEMTGKNGTRYRNYDFSSQPIDKKNHFELPETVNSVSCNNLTDEKLNDFFKVGWAEKVKTVFVYYLSLIIGRKNTAYLIHVIKREK